MQPDLNRFPIVKLAQQYRRILTDSRTLSLRASIEVVRGRIQQLAERIDFADAPDRMNILAELWKEYIYAKSKGKRADEIILEDKLTTQFAAARDDYAAWEQMIQALDLDRKLVDSEIKVYKEMRSILTVEDAYELMGKMLSIILRVFPDDKEKLKRVQYEVIKLIGDRPMEPVEENDQEDDENVLDADENEPLHAV